VIPFALFSIPLFSQPDSTWVPYVGGFDFREGIYADFQSFRLNAPMWPMNVLTDTEGRPITDLKKAARVFAPDSAGRKELVLDRQWGFCNNDVVYVTGPQGFSRIGMMGTLSHLLLEQTYRTYDPYNYGCMQQSVQVEYLLDMETGRLEPFQASTFEVILKRDSLLFEEWSALDKKQKRRVEVLHLFMRRYNESHPLLFPR
jgi:hypothetical protein